MLTIISSAGGADHVLSSPQEIVENFSAATPRVPLSEFGASPTWPILLAGLEAGKEPWIRAAAAVRLHTDAGASSELDVAFFSALRRNPVAVLRLFGPVGHPRLDAAYVCNRNFLIDAPDPDVAGVIADTIARLRKVSDRKLAASRDACVQHLRKETR
jgi:hypothetical protein